MKVGDLIILTLFGACAGDDGGVEVSDPKVICAHPVSRQESQIVAVYPDYSDVKAVEFLLEQERGFWMTWLEAPTENKEYWHTQMQAVGFDCKEDYYYDFIEVINESR